MKVYILINSIDYGPEYRQAFVPDTLEDNKKWIKNIYLQTFKMHNNIPDPEAEAMFRGVMSALNVKEESRL